jgi:hypothetical protein
MYGIYSVSCACCSITYFHHRLQQTLVLMFVCRMLFLCSHQVSSKWGRWYSPFTIHNSQLKWGRWYSQFTIHNSQLKGGEGIHHSPFTIHHSQLNGGRWHSQFPIHNSQLKWGRGHSQFTIHNSPFTIKVGAGR